MIMIFNKNNFFIINDDDNNDRCRLHKTRYIVIIIIIIICPQCALHYESLVKIITFRYLKTLTYVTLCIKYCKTLKMLIVKF